MKHLPPSLINELELYIQDVVRTAVRQELSRPAEMSAMPNLEPIAEPITDNFQPVTTNLESATSNPQPVTSNNMVQAQDILKRVMARQQPQPQV